MGYFICELCGNEFPKNSGGWYRQRWLCLSCIKAIAEPGRIAIIPGERKSVRRFFWERVGLFWKKTFKEGYMLKLGDEVRDRVSGFTGIAVARHSYLQGCDRVTVQPHIDKDGKLPEPESFDEPQLDVVTLQKARRTASAVNPGGPEKHSDFRRF